MFADHVDEANTSKTCPNCASRTDVSLDDRIFVCGDCGCVAHRDIKASLLTLVKHMDGDKVVARIEVR